VMWLAFTEGWLSIVAHRSNPDMLLVRARQERTIPRIFGKGVMFTDPTADYLYRAEIPRDKVIEVVSKRFNDMQYDNFKNTISDIEYANACMDVWHVMFGLQRGVYK